MLHKIEPFHIILEITFLAVVMKGCHMLLLIVVRVAQKMII